MFRLLLGNASDDNKALFLQIFKESETLEIPRPLASRPRRSPFSS